MVNVRALVQQYQLGEALLSDRDGALRRALLRLMGGLLEAGEVSEGTRKSCGSMTSEHLIGYAQKAEPEAIDRGGTLSVASSGSSSGLVLPQVNPHLHLLLNLVCVSLNARWTCCGPFT